MIKEFKTFINEGDVVDLSIGVVAGVAFVTLAEAFTVGLVAPFVRIILGTDGTAGGSSLPGKSLTSPWLSPPSLLSPSKFW